MRVDVLVFSGSCDLALCLLQSWQKEWSCAAGALLLAAWALTGVYSRCARSNKPDRLPREPSACTALVEPASGAPAGLHALRALGHGDGAPGLILIIIGFSTPPGVDSLAALGGFRWSGLLAYCASLSSTASCRRAGGAQEIDLLRSWSG